MNLSPCIMRTVTRTLSRVSVRQDEESGELGYQVVPGILKRVCQRAKADPEQRYAIFIDEINRGNICRSCFAMCSRREYRKATDAGRPGHYRLSRWRVDLDCQDFS